MLHSLRYPNGLEHNMKNLPNEVIGLILMIFSVITTTIILIPIIAETRIEGQLVFVLYLIPIILNLSTIIMAIEIFIKKTM